MKKIAERILGFFKIIFGFLKKVLKSVRFRKVVKRFCIFCVCFGIFIGILTLSLNLYVKKSVDENILTVEEAANLSDVDCIIVLGCGIKPDGTPSDMLRDRLNFAIDIYKKGGAPKLLMSGDHGRVGYNEVGVMKQYAINKGVPSEDVFMDHAGFSTYETMYRAKEIFKAEKVIVVTQEYHLYRGMYNAEKMGMESYGVASDVYWYENEFYRESREMIARCKDFIWCLFKVEPTYLGDAIPVSGNGDATNDY
ncbi:MAG: SanA protein [Ruminococcaceae bacterium]|nr:SanA protein [Oscillospiraceae bacterium]